MTPLTPWNSPSCSSPTYSRNMVCHPMSPPTRAWSSSLTSSNPLANYSRWNSTSCQDTTQKGMDSLNQVLEQYLQAYMNYQQDDWSSLLPLAEFAYNNATNEMTGVSLFFANKGYHPSFATEPNEQVSSPEAQRFILDLDDLHTELKRSITRAQEHYQKYADEHHSPAPLLKIGNQVYVKVKYFRTTRPSKKLSKKNLGPYEVITIPSSHSFTLHLPQHFCSVHPIFHISQLEPAEPDPFPQCTQPPPPPVEIN